MLIEMDKKDCTGCGACLLYTSGIYSIDIILHGLIQIILLMHL